jgi:hypothetical protein
MNSPVIRIQGTSRLEKELQEKGCHVEWVL